MNDETNQQTATCASASASASISAPSKSETGLKIKKLFSFKKSNNEYGYNPIDPKDHNVMPNGDHQDEDTEYSNKSKTFKDCMNDQDIAIWTNTKNHNNDASNTNDSSNNNVSTLSPLESESKQKKHDNHKKNNKPSEHQNDGNSTELSNTITRYNNIQNDPHSNFIEQHQQPQQHLEQQQEQQLQNPEKILRNFILFSILFSANHGAVVSCLSLAIARLGTLGAYQSGALYLSYTTSAFFFGTHIIQSLGPKRSVVVAMWTYCAYVGCFALAVWFQSLGWHQVEIASAIVGGILGGVGAGFLWTAQGSYYARACEDYAMNYHSYFLASSHHSISSLHHTSQTQPQPQPQPSPPPQNMTVEDAASHLGTIFAAIYLSEEVILRLLSTVALKLWHSSWLQIFTLYTAAAILSTSAMIFVHEHPPTEAEQTAAAALTKCDKLLSASRLLFRDSKMKYLVPLCAIFGFSSSFIASFVNAQVVRIALSDASSADLGLLTSVTSAVAAIMSLVLGYAARKFGRGPVLILGSASFFFVAFPFLVRPNLGDWGWVSLLCVYSLQGVGRATFEGTLRAEFAIVFAHQKEAAFANIVFQNGLVTAAGFFLFANLTCSHPGTYCLLFSDGELHNVLAFELVILISAVLSIFGYLRASALYRIERNQREASLLTDDHLL